jgi:Zn-dependent oligopeptidase
MKLFGKFSTPQSLLDFAIEARTQLMKSTEKASKANSAKALVDEIASIEYTAQLVQNPCSVIHTMSLDSQWKDAAKNAQKEFRPKGGNYAELNESIVSKIWKFRNDPTLSKAQARLLKLHIHEREEYIDPEISHKSRRQIEKLHKEIDELSRSVSYVNLETTLTKLRDRRADLAHSLGHPTFAHMIHRNFMTGTPEAAINFLSDYAKEIEFLPAELEPKFEMSINDALGGLVELCRDIFKLEITPVDVIGLSSNVHCFQISSIGKNNLINYPTDPLGYVYMDMFPRRKKDANYSYLSGITPGRELQDGTYEIPHCYLNMNVPSGSKMEWKDVTTLFHEFGHALHYILGRSKYQQLSMRSPDFYEMPSQFMELFLNDDRVLKRYWGFEKIERVFPESKDTPHGEIVKGLLDIAMHITDKSIQDVYEECADKVNYSEPYSRSILEFTFATHPTRYFSFLYSRRFANLLWDRFFKADPWKGGQKYIELLKDGGGLEPREILNKTFK